MSRKALPVLLLFVATIVGAAAWFVLQDPDMPLDVKVFDGVSEPPPPPLEAQETQAPLTQPVASERHEPGATTVVLPLEVELELVQRGSFDRIDGLLPRGSGATAELTGAIYGLDSKGSSATITFVGGPNLGRVLQTDMTGSFGATDLFAGLDIVLVRTVIGHLAQREVRLREGRQEQLNISFARPATVYGSCKDRAGEPIVGAIINLDGQESYTDDLGEFQFPRVAGGKALLIVDKPGYALYREIVPIMAGRVVPKDRLSFVLAPAASLEVHIQETLGARQAAKLYLIPSGGQRVNTTVGQRTFPWHLVNPVDIYPGASALIEQLPEGSVNMLLFHSGAVAKPRQSRIKLTPGRKRTQQLHLEPANELHGQVLKNGKPAANVIVQLEAPDRTAATIESLQKHKDFNHGMVLPHLPSGLQKVRADKAGKFYLTAGSERSKGFYLSAYTEDGEWSANSIVQAGGDAIELNLKRVTDDAGAIRVQLPGRHQALPIEVRVKGGPRDPYKLAASDDLIVDGLERGTWRLSLRFDGEYLTQGQLLRLESSEAVYRCPLLPKGAIDGQTEEERRRAGK
jgi:hypothetical protein